MIPQGEGCREDVGGRVGVGAGRKHVKGKKNRQLQKFAPLGHVSCVTVMYFAPRGVKGNGAVQCPWGFSCYPAVRTGYSNDHFFLHFDSAVRTGSSNTRFFL